MPCFSVFICFFHLAYSFDLKKSESSSWLFFGYFLFVLLPLAQVHLSLILCMPRICWKLSRWSKIGIDASEYTRGSQTQPTRFDPIRFNRSHGIVKPNWCHICIHIRFLLFPPLLIAVWVRLLCAAFVYYPVRCWAIVGCRLFTFKLNTLFHPINAEREREGIEYRHLGSHQPQWHLLKGRLVKFFFAKQTEKQNKNRCDRKIEKFASKSGWISFWLPNRVIPRRCDQWD